MKKSVDKPLTSAPTGIAMLGVMSIIACLAIMGGILILALNPTG